MGSGIQEAGLFRSERYEYEQRTSDPTDTVEGESWLRTDIAPETDQIATLRLDDGGGTVDIPVYDTAATTGSDVADIWRVRVGGTTGFIPTVEQAGTYEQLRIQHNGTYRGAHDALTFSAIPDGAVDNFEEALYEDKSNTLSDYYTGDVSEFDRNTNSPVYEGSYSLKLTGDASNGMYSTSGLPNYPAQGDIYRQNFYVIDADAQIWFRFGLVDNNNCYQVIYEDNKNNLDLQLKDGGSTTSLDSINLSLSTGEFYELETDWKTDGTINVDVSDDAGNSQGSLSGSDGTYTDGGIGWRSGNTNSYAIDNARIA